MTTPPTDPLAVLVERLSTIRDEQRTVLGKLDLIQTQLIAFGEFKATTQRDLADMRQDLQVALLKHADLARTTTGIGNAFDDYRANEALRTARLQGQLVLLRWALGIATAVITTVIIAFVTHQLGF